MIDKSVYTEIITQLTSNPNIRVVKRQDVIKVNYLTCPFCGKEKHFSIFLPKIVGDNIENIINYISDGNEFGYVCYRCKQFHFPEKVNKDTTTIINILKHILQSSYFTDKSNDGKGYSRKFTIFALWELYLKKFNLWEENTSINILVYLKNRKIDYELIQNTTNIKFYTYLTYDDKKWKKVFSSYKDKVDKIVSLYKYQSFLAIGGGYPNSGIILRNTLSNVKFRYYTGFDMPVIIKYNDFEKLENVIMTEGVMDALSLYTILSDVSDLDINNTLFVSANGLRFYSALDWVKKLYGNWNKLYIFGDNDVWTKQEVKYPKSLLSYVYFINDEKYKDINEFLKSLSIKVLSFKEFMENYIVAFTEKQNYKIINNLKNVLKQGG